MLMSAMLTSEDNKRISSGEAMRYEVTIGYRILMLLKDCDSS